MILVEGPTDELIIQRAYKDKYGHLPIEDGIDVIAVNSLAFKRYLDIAKILNKKVTIVTDNDGDIDKNIKQKYSEYDSGNFKYCYEENEKLKTIEPSILEVNIPNLDEFSSIISKNGSLKNKNKEKLLEFMLNNKSEWALRVFNNEKCIVYPKYIQEAIDE